MTNLERVSYIRGLMEGLELETDKKEVKVLTAIMDLLEDMALSLSEVENTCEDMANQLDAVDEDLCCLEDDYYGDRDEEDEEECYYEVTCPSCQETICLSEDVLEAGEIDCPTAGNAWNLTSTMWWTSVLAGAGTITTATKPTGERTRAAVDIPTESPYITRRQPSGSALQRGCRTAFLLDKSGLLAENKERVPVLCLYFCGY